MSEKITALRQKIDEIDEKILLLLKERIEISKKIGEEKRKRGIPLRDLERENEKYRQIAEKASKLKLDPEEVKKVYREIIDMSVHAQES
ncbi:MAG: chorismate mutase [Candidatus Bathyarchaeota archaeon]|nr:chorismate mutase [Candidatus Bathyarchaeota archaeon]MDW8023467.1 chorismate mutase [Nitrososphaerota archaeon]MDW8041101.1 chorismate mutase [Nitrososphaerota archaeon]